MRKVSLGNVLNPFSIFGVIAGAVGNLFNHDGTHRTKFGINEIMRPTRLRHYGRANHNHLIGANVVPVIQNEIPSRQYARHCARKGIKPR